MGQEFLESSGLYNEFEIRNEMYLSKLLSLHSLFTVITITIRMLYNNSLYLF